MTCRLIIYEGPLQKLFSGFLFLLFLFCCHLSMINYYVGRSNLDWAITVCKGMQTLPVLLNYHLKIESLLYLNRLLIDWANELC